MRPAAGTGGAHHQRPQGRGSPNERRFLPRAPGPQTAAVPSPQASYPSSSASKRGCTAAADARGRWAAKSAPIQPGRRFGSPMKRHLHPHHVRVDGNAAWEHLNAFELPKARRSAATLLHIRMDIKAPSTVLESNAMAFHRLLALVTVVAVMAGCGGSPDEPQSERNAYGRTVEEMQQAPASGRQQRGSRYPQVGDSSNHLSDKRAGRWTLDPISGRTDFEPGSFRNSGESWLVGAALVGATGEPVATEWSVRTLWVLNGNSFISSRDLTSSESLFWSTGYPNPPFSTAGAVVVAELVRGQETRLISVPPVRVPMSWLR